MAVVFTFNAIMVRMCEVDAVIGERFLKNIYQRKIKQRKNCGKDLKQIIFEHYMKKSPKKKKKRVHRR